MIELIEPTERSVYRAEEGVSPEPCHEDFPLYDVTINPCCVSIAMEHTDSSDYTRSIGPDYHVLGPRHHGSCGDMAYHLGAQVL